MNDDDIDMIDYDVQPEAIHGLDIAALERANWHLRKIGEAEMELHTLESVYRNEMRRLGERLDARVGKIRARIEWHSTPVKQLHAALLASDPKRKTIELPHGTLKAKVSAKARIFIESPDVVQEWVLSNHPDLCPPKQVLVTDLRNALVVGADLKVIDPATGETVPGLTASVPPTTYSIDTTSGDL